MPELLEFIHEYIDLERQVQRHMNRACLRFCGICQNCCCRYDICEESLDSAFLCEVRSCCPPSDELSDAYGWLTQTGCALTAGRPPVCYEFICDNIMHGQPDEAIRYALRVLGMTLTYAGKRAIASTHLVEILDPAQLERINLQRLRKQHQEARTALHDAVSIIQGNTEHATSAMYRVCPPETDLLQGA
jgi:hypothetical protein